MTNLMPLNKIFNYLLLVFLFLLPWQSRIIYEHQYLNGGHWEYGSLSFFATEILLWLIVILFAIENFGKKEFWKKITTMEHWQKHKNNLFTALLILLGLFLPVLFSIDFKISYQHFLWVLGGMCLAIVVTSLSFRAERGIPVQNG